MRFTQFFTVSALAAFASAQTFTDCDPTKKDCPNDPAMAKSFSTDFKGGAAGVKGWKQTAGLLTYNNEGAQFTINKKGDAPTIQTETYLHFGYIEVKCKSAPGQGVISSIVLQSEDLDEVDWEFLGTVNSKVQMNYFGKGNTTTYDRMIEAPVTTPQNGMHTYALDWTAERLIWLIDGQPIRTLKYADANGGKNYPQTPSTVRIGIWAGGDPDNEKGVIEWAGGKIDYTKGPYTMTVESVKITNNSPGKEYKWTDKSGSWESIEVIGKGDESGAPQNSAVLTASGTGAGVGSGINVPTGSSNVPAPTGGAGSSYTGGAGSSSTCTESKSKPTTSVIGTNGTSPSASCSCGTGTVTVTGPSPPAVPSTLVSSLAPPPIITSAYSTTIPVTTSPPYPTTGLITDTNPPPKVPFPTGGIPGGNGTTSAPPPLFTGAASSNKGGAMVVILAAAAALIV